MFRVKGSPHLDLMRIESLPFFASTIFEKLKGVLPSSLSLLLKTSIF